MISLEAYTFIF